MRFNAKTLDCVDGIDRFRLETDFASSIFAVCLLFESVNVFDVKELSIVKDVQMIATDTVNFGNEWFAIFFRVG